MKRALTMTLVMSLILPLFAFSEKPKEEFTLGFFTYKLSSDWIVADYKIERRVHYIGQSEELGEQWLYVYSPEEGMSPMLTPREISRNYEKQVSFKLENHNTKKTIYNKAHTIAGTEGRIFGIKQTGTFPERFTHVHFGIVILGHGMVGITYLHTKGSDEQGKGALASLLEDVEYIGPTPFNPKDYGTFKYRTVARNPDNFIGTRVKIRGTVVQVMGTAKEGFTMRVATKGRYDDIIYVTTQSNMHENLLEKDVLDLYCELIGEYTYSSILGSSITLPSAKLEFYTIRK